VAVPGRGCRGEVGCTGIGLQHKDPAIRIGPTGPIGPVGPVGPVGIDPPLADQHAIPVTIKTVVFGDRVAVSLQDILAPGEGRNQR